MNWADGTGRREGHHYFNAFNKILIRTPADPEDTAPEAAMSQRAWEVLLRDVIRGLCHPYTPKTLRRWLPTTHPQAWAIRAPQTSPSPPRHHHIRKRKGKGKARGKGARRGPR